MVIEGNPWRVGHLLWLLSRCLVSELKLIVRASGHGEMASQGWLDFRGDLVILCSKGGFPAWWGVACGVDQGLLNVP